MSPDVNEPAFWQKIYEEGDAGWDLGEATPPLVDLLATAAPGPAGGRVAVVGCGRGHDARAFARAGYDVRGFDFAPAAIDEAAALARKEGLEIAFERRDVFTLGEAYPAAFDIVWEYTCFCAIDPVRRDEYVDVIHATLKPGGVLLGLFYPVREGDLEGPPYPSTEPEIRRRLEGRFRIESMEAPARSAERRAGKERLVRSVRVP